MQGICLYSGPAYFNWAWTAPATIMAADLSRAEIPMRTLARRELNYIL